MDELDGWTCHGQADLLADVEACPSCGAGTRLTAHGPVCDNRVCPDPFWKPQSPHRAAEVAA